MMMVMMLMLMTFVGIDDDDLCTGALLFHLLLFLFLRSLSTSLRRARASLHRSPEASPELTNESTALPSIPPSQPRTPSPSSDTPGFCLLAAALFLARVVFFFPSSLVSMGGDDVDPTKWRMLSMNERTPSLLSDR